MALPPSMQQPLMLPWRGAMGGEQQQQQPPPSSQLAILPPPRPAEEEEDDEEETTSGGTASQRASPAVKRRRTERDVDPSPSQSSGTWQVQNRSEWPPEYEEQLAAFRAEKDPEKRRGIWGTAEPNMRKVLMYAATPMQREQLRQFREKRRPQKGR